MKVGDIVSWTPEYAVNDLISMSRWLGVVVEKEQERRSGCVKVQWYINQEGYYETDWTPAKDLIIISRS